MPTSSFIETIKITAEAGENIVRILESSPQIITVVVNENKRSIQDYFNKTKRNTKKNS